MSLVQLTLVAPRRLEDELVELLLAHPDWAGGFTLFQGQGYSVRLDTLSASERVRGRALRSAIQIVLDDDRVAELLGHLKARFPKRDVAYWLTPVLDFGRLA
jgi:hypothetical protein